MNDDEIEAMEKELDDEKKLGLGVPTEVTNAVAQQQMMGDVQLDQMAQQQEMMPPDTGTTAKPAAKPQPKTNSKPSGNYDLSLEDTTFTKLKRIL